MKRTNQALWTLMAVPLMPLVFYACEENSGLQEVKDAVVEMKKNMAADGSSGAVAAAADAQTDKGKAAEGTAAPAPAFTADEAIIISALEEQIATVAAGCEGKDKEKACVKDFTAAIAKGTKAVKTAVKKVKKPAPEFVAKCKDLSVKRDEIVGNLPKTVAPKLKPKVKGFDAVIKKICK